MDCKITFSGRFHYRQGDGVALHQHEYDYQIQLVYQGAALIEVNDAKFIIKPGDIVLVKKGDLHSFSVIAKEGMKTLEIKLITEDEHLVKLLKNNNTLFQDKDNQIFNIFSNIVLEGQRKIKDYKIMTNALLLESLVLMSRLYSPDLESSFERASHARRSAVVKESPVIEAVTEYVYKNIDRNFSLQEMADACGYNRDYLYRAIKKERGFSAVQFVNMIKFEQAKKLIHHSELSLSEISWNLGFDSLQYFSRFFKQYANVSPSEYSAKVRNTIRTDY